MMDPGSPVKPKRPRPLMLDVHVPAESRSYPVVIGRGAIGRLGAELQQRLGRTGAAVAVVTDTTVAPLHGAMVQANLEAQGFTVVPIVIPAGEANKTTGTLLEVLGSMIVNGMGRRDAVVALGGGVVGDLSGLAAAMFFIYALLLVGRGLPFWLGTALFVTAFVLLFQYTQRRADGRRRRGIVVALACGVITSAVVTVVFEQLFYVRLP